MNATYSHEAPAALALQLNIVQRREVIPQKEQSVGPLFGVRAEAYSQGPVLGRTENQSRHLNGFAGQLLRVRAGREVLVVKHREGSGGQVKYTHVQIKFLCKRAKDCTPGRAVTEEYRLNHNGVSVGGVVKL